MKLVIIFLETELNLLIRSKEKSIKSFKKGDITKETHTTHIVNLTILINQFSLAIETLKK